MLVTLRYLRDVTGVCECVCVCVLACARTCFLRVWHCLRVRVSLVPCKVRCKWVTVCGEFGCAYGPLRREVIIVVCVIWVEQHPTVTPLGIQHSRPVLIPIVHHILHGKVLLFSQKRRQSTLERGKSPGEMGNFHRFY